MNQNNVGPNEFWGFNISQNFQGNKIQNLENFKSNEVNFKLALWNPNTNGVRYLKALLFNLCAFLSQDNWQRVSRIKNRNIGSPFSIRFNGIEICMDYFQAVLELEFINNHLNPDDLTILEIGAGYGRTCHSIISNHNVSEYIIIDLNPSLALSKKYLETVLTSQQFSKIKFIPTEDFAMLKNRHFDLCINIDSFAEMDEEVVKSYQKVIDFHCSNFYVKNPVGKYHDKTLDGHAQGSEIVALAMKTGILREVIDIHDNDEIQRQVPKFINAYQPGSGWECVHNSWSPPWSFYWQALYKKC